MTRRRALIGAIVMTAMAGTPVAAQTRSVWDGVYTAEQATRGSASFDANCARCHSGETAGGDEGRPLTGDAFWQSYQESTVDDLLKYIRENMPNGAGGSLSVHTYVDLVAFLLKGNGLPAGAAELTSESTLGVRIVRQGGSGELPDQALARVVGCLTRGEGRNWVVTSATAPERIREAGVGGDDASRPLGTRTIPLMFVLTSLDRQAGQRVSVSGLLMGDGGAKGINVTIVRSVAQACP